MITFTKLGNYGRLGNQLFQYAYLRSMAIRLETQFWCPEWEGDVIFDLDDDVIRSSKKPEIIGPVYDPAPQAGYVATAFDVKDGAEIQGYFQSNLFFINEKSVKEWYKFKKELIEDVQSKFDMSLMNQAVSFSLRLDDDYKKTREFFPSYPLKYYRMAFDEYDRVENLIVFADRIDLARKYLENEDFGCRVTYVDGFTAAQQLYLMTKCELGNIITNSTFAWWGGYLNSGENSKTVVPQEWVRPGVPVGINEIIPAEWKKLQTLHPVFDNFQYWRIRHPIDTLKRIINRIH